MNVKFNNSAWLLESDGGTWIDINQKDWEKVRKLCYINTPISSKKSEWFIFSSTFQPTPDQIYSLPNEVEFKIKGYVLNEHNNWIVCDEIGNWYEKYKTKGATVKQVAHLKDSEQKKEGWEKSWEEINYQLGSSGGVNLHAFRLGWLQAKKEVERSEEVKKESTVQQILDIIESNFNCSCTDLICEAKGSTHKAAIAIFERFILKDSQSEIESLRANLEDSINERDKIVLQAGERIKELESKLAQSVKLDTVKDIVDKLSPREEKK